MLGKLQTERRRFDGLQIANRAKIERRGDFYVVPSLERKGSYAVVPDANNATCTCPHYELHREPCRHIYAVQFHIQREQDQNARLPTLPRPKQPSSATGPRIMRLR
jgi:hypothetical protein